LDGFTGPREYYFESKTGTASVYFDAYISYEKPRKGLKLYWTFAKM